VSRRYLRTESGSRLSSLRGAIPREFGRRLFILQDKLGQIREVSESGQFAPKEEDEELTAPKFRTTFKGASSAPIWLPGGLERLIRLRGAGQPL
jgi:hypothetical protein